MPPLSTIVMEDDDTSSSAVFELNSNQFTYFSNDDALSNFILNILFVTTPKLPRKRRRLVIFI